ncbi:DNA-binding storekeeper protein-relatedtranscriptional regulator [Heracleum sosnowskyi]|uniref:DNA-binding storekeeper protein-relatedtranscriptional regulator n=1 Tax=Heracleum sosnowskyi TaxID=360622 RepID=A0AAD8IPZ4_9APIA|nr:DNA-binding storekeeper protein-relatedtranscriptional regulator [Heracleum sosnowskyi]
MNCDPSELEFDKEGETNMEHDVVEDNITSIGTTPEWTSFRDNLVEIFFNEWRERGAGRNKRKWTEDEDEKLVEALMELVNTGNFKADNGFKPGYLTYLENSMQIKLPNAGLKGKPHIESRIKTFKKDFTVVYDIRYGANSSGFGWNSEEHLVTAPRDVWIQYLKVHPKAAKWKSTHLPCFKELSIIFRKDRATENLAENLEDVAEELNTEVVGETLRDDIQPNPISDESTSKKRKKGNVESLLEAVYAASERMANQFEASTKLLIAAEEDMLLKKKQLNEELSKIPKLTILHKFQVAKRIAKDEDLMILFFAAPTEEKIVFVNVILDNEV